MTTLVMVAILVFGIVSYQQLPVSDLPNVDFPTITVTATLPGTSPQTMAATVATPLEKQFSTIAGIDNMTSTSSLGQSQVVIQIRARSRRGCSRAGRAGGDCPDRSGNCRRESFHRRTRRRTRQTHRS